MCSRGHWRPSEDEKLRELVERYGPHNWNAIAEKLKGRSGNENDHFNNSIHLLLATNFIYSTQNNNLIVKYHNHLQILKS